MKFFASVGVQGLSYSNLSREVSCAGVGQLLAIAIQPILKLARLDSIPRHILSLAAITISVASMTVWFFLCLPLSVLAVAASSSVVKASFCSPTFSPVASCGYYFDLHFSLSLSFVAPPYTYEIKPVVVVQTGPGEC